MPNNCLHPNCKHPAIWWITSHCGTTYQRCGEHLNMALRSCNTGGKIAVVSQFTPRPVGQRALMESEGK
jgi:hypothetical protein